MYTLNITEEEIRERFENIKIRVFQEFYNAAPVDTGYLRSMIKMTIMEDGFSIYVDVPYMQYTEEPWTGSRSHLTNPNERWWRNVVEKIFNTLVEELRR